MKKILILICFSTFVFGYSQEKEPSSFKKNEIKVNALTLITGGINCTYEHIFNEESGLGVAVFVSADENVYTTKFSLTSFYRFYFGKKPAAGFYAEGFGMFDTFKYASNIFLLDLWNSDNHPGTLSDFALGLGLGGKWVSKKGFIFEINSGIGRNLFNTKSNDYGHQMVLRGGLTLGYRLN